MNKTKLTSKAAKAMSIFLSFRFFLFCPLFDFTEASDSDVDKRFIMMISCGAQVLYLIPSKFLVVYNLYL